MDFLNKGYEQILDLLKSMTPGARITSGLLLVVIVVSVAYLFGHVSTGQETYLMGGESFSSSHMPAMLEAFAKAGLSDYEVEGSRISVPASRQSAYMAALADSGAMPPTFGKYLEKAVGVNPWASKEQRREAIQIAKQNELNLIVSNMRGIESAAVLYDSKAEGGLYKQTITTASVSVKPLGNVPLDANQARMLRHLVAGSIAGLKPESITVTDLNGKVYPGTTSGSMAAGSADDPYFERKKSYEEEWSDKIGSALSYIPGVHVTSNVELDTETDHEETHTDFDPKSVPYNQRESSLTKTLRGAGQPQGRPGLTAQENRANQPAVVNNNASSGSENNEETSQVDTQSAIPSKVRHWKQQGLTPKRVTVAVGIPSSYYEKVWLEKNPPLAGKPPVRPDANALAEIESRVKKDVQDSVVALLPSPGGAVDPFPRITVTTFQHLPVAALPMPSIADKAIAWTGQYWSTLGTLGLAGAALVMLRSMLRSAPTAPPRPRLAAIDETEDSPITTASGNAGSNEPVSGRSRLKRRTAAGPSLREELSEVIKEDPDAAVSVLRTWIGNAS